MFARRVFATGQQLAEQALIKIGWLFFIEPCECGAGNGPGTKVVQFEALGFEVGLDISQALGARNLCHDHADELIPSRGRSKFLA